MSSTGLADSAVLATPAEASPAADVRGGLRSRSFLALLATQFLGAMNDNLFRWLAIPVGAAVLTEATSLTVGTVGFTLPYLLLATCAGFLADRFDKRTVIVGCKLAEIVLMLLAVGVLFLGNIWLLFVVVALMGSQSALFSPSKFGSIPEMLRSDKISAGNGVMGLVTVVASALGTFAGLGLFFLHKTVLLGLFGIAATEPAGAMEFSHIGPVALALISTAVVGWLVSLTIVPLSAADPERRLPPNPLSETVRSLRLLAGNTPLLRTALGIAFFWLLASLAQMNVNVFGTNELALSEPGIGVLLVILVVGVGVGSVLAGWWSGGKVELGIVPLGAVGIVISACLLYLAGSSVDPANPVTAQTAWWWSAVWLCTLGVSAGLFNVPLEAFLQHRSEVQTRGTILAAGNFISFSLILLSALLFYVMQSDRLLSLSASTIFLIAGLGTLPVAVYIFYLLPQATIRFLVWLASHTMYRIRVYDRGNLPESGGALLVANHVSWLDGIFLLLTSSRPIRMIAYADYVEKGPVGWLARTFGVIPIKPSAGPKGVMRALKTAREAIENGELVGIFAEGQITRTGQLQPFQRGMMRIIEGTGAPVVPIYLDELWGSIFSYRGGRFFWKRPRRWPYPVSILFGEPITEPEDVHQVRAAVENLGVDAMEKRKDRQPVPQRLFLRKCKKALFRTKIADSSGTELTGGKLLTATLMFKRLLERQVFAPDEKMVGLLLPPSCGGTIANAAVSLSRRVAVNLNYTLHEETVNHCIRESGIRHVLTSRRFLEKRPMKLDAELVFLEDLKEQVTKLDKLAALSQAYLLPSAALERLHGLTEIDPDDLLTVIFTSGSTGEPKGVMLSHHNVMSNIDGVDQLFHITGRDVFLGVLPFFHSFGFAGTLWLPLTLDPKCVYHFNPLDARMVGKLCEQHGVTILIATPTFLRTYMKRIDKQQLHALDVAIVGAEKLPRDLADEFHEKFGVLPTEGYGTTELSPVAAANVPEHRAGVTGQKGTKLGTVGRPFPGVTARVVDPESGEDLGIGREGLLLIKGPNVMQGYLNQPEKTAEVLRDGWYNTGDFAKIDEEGFIEITGRQSRFSKIGGEMVPHIRIEEILNRIAADPEDEEAGPKLAVTAVPDAKKGERLIVLHRPLSKPVEQIVAELAAAGVPNLWIPSPDSFVEVEEVPILGTGKLDLKGLKDLALAQTSRSAPESSPAETRS